MLLFFPCMVYTTRIFITRRSKPTIYTNLHMCPVLVSQMFTKKFQLFYKYVQSKIFEQEKKQWKKQTSTFHTFSDFSQVWEYYSFLCNEPIYQKYIDFLKEIKIKDRVSLKRMSFTADRFPKWTWPIFHC